MLMAKNLLLALLLAFVFMNKLTEAQLPDCYFQEVNLVPCLTSGAAGNTSKFCCQALNQALSTGHQCLCSILFSTNLFPDPQNPIPASPQGIQLPGCSLSVPSISSCQDIPAIMAAPARDTNSTVATLQTPTTSILINNTVNSQDVPVREGQESMDMVSQSGNIDQAGASISRKIQIIYHLLCIACIWLVISGLAFPTFLV